MMHGKSEVCLPATERHGHGCLGECWLTSRRSLNMLSLNVSSEVTVRIAWIECS
jgi:hypothetical protein